MRSQQHGDCGTQLNGVASSGTDTSDSVSERADDVVSEEPKSSTKEETSDDQDPDWCVSLAGNLPGHVCLVRSDPRSNSVSNIIGTI